LNKSRSAHKKSLNKKSRSAHKKILNNKSRSAHKNSLNKKRLNKRLNKSRSSQKKSRRSTKKFYGGLEGGEEVVVPQFGSSNASGPLNPNAMSANFNSVLLESSQGSVYDKDIDK
jgi:hypothetical protein